MNSSWAFFPQPGVSKAEGLRAGGASGVSASHSMAKRARLHKAYGWKCYDRKIIVYDVIMILPGPTSQSDFRFSNLDVPRSLTAR
jgi:hypothetical protein